jgi:PKD repeat protein
VLIEWLTKGGKETLCRQLLRVGCGEKPELVPEDEKVIDTGSSSHCRCLSAETDSDEESNEYAEPDLSVEVGGATLTGLMEITVPYTIEVEPPNLQFTRQWEVTALDEIGEEQPITVPFTDDLIGKAIFTVPEAGDYNFYLTITDPATCVSERDRDDDDYTDTDFTAFKVTAGRTRIKTEANIEPCDPLVYRFTSDSDPGLNPKWEVLDTTKPAGQQVIFTATGPVLNYSFPAFNVLYKVILTTYDQNNTPSQDIVLITPTIKENKPNFTWDPYNSCGFDNFVVQFVNKSKADPCPITAWDWDFGDGTPHSSQQHPQHTFVAAGTYNVKLSMTVVISGIQTVFTTTISFRVKHWAPSLTYTDCGDGTVVYTTDATPGWNWDELHRERTWSFPDGDANWHEHLHRHKKKVRVCYDKPGMKIAKVHGINEDKAECETIQEVFITSIARCCPRDKIVKKEFYFLYNKQYLLLATFRYFGRPHGIILAKCKLKALNKKNKWKRYVAYNLGLEIDGDVFSKVGDCFCAKDHHVHGQKSHSNRARRALRVLPAFPGRIRVKQDGLTCTYTVKVDSNDPGWNFQLSLWENDCGCP